MQAVAEGKGAVPIANVCKCEAEDYGKKVILL